MNRQERRQLKKQGIEVPTEPTVNVKVSDLFKRQKMTPEMKAEMHRAIDEDILDRDKKYKIHTDAMFMWYLHTRLGFGPKRLRKAYFDMFKDYYNMRERFETDEEYPELQKLKEKGADVQAWYEELFDDQGNFKNPEAFKDEL